MAEPEAGSQHSKKTMADRHKHVQAIARETCNALEVSKPESSFGRTLSDLSGLDAGEHAMQQAMSSESSCAQVEVLQRHGRQVNCAVFYDGSDVAPPTQIPASDSNISYPSFPILRGHRRSPSDPQSHAPIPQFRGKGGDEINPRPSTLSPQFP